MKLINQFLFAGQTRLLADSAHIMLEAHLTCTLMMDMQRLSLSLIQKPLALGLHFTTGCDPRHLIP